MSEYTTDQILKIIENPGVAGNVNLIRCNLSSIDLSSRTIQAKYDDWIKQHDTEEPVWYSKYTKGIFLGRAWLDDAYLVGASLQSADLLEAHLEGAFLDGASLQSARLREAHLQDASFNKTNLHGADLRRADIREIDLEAAETLEGVYLEKARLHRTWLRAGQIKQVGEERDKDYKMAQSAYLALKVNFKEIGYYDDVRWAYLKERAMERKSHSWHSLPWLWSWVQNIFTGYIERIWVIILWLILWPAIFTLLYWVSGGMINNPGYASPEFPRDYFFFSLRTMVTLAYSDFTPVGAGQWLAPLEGALGIIFLALLGFSVAKRIARD